MLNYQRVFSISNYQIASFHMFSQVSSNDIPIFSISKWFPMAPKRPATRSSRWKTTRRAASWPYAGTGRANAQCWRSLTSAVPGTCLGWKSQGDHGEMEGNTPGNAMVYGGWMVVEWWLNGGWMMDGQIMPTHPRILVFRTLVVEWWNDSPPIIPYKLSV